ncbi:MAG TPA: helix-turn-helix domain-containing protein, partial [Gammaproteobacteria bacterium]|nr:helix-turn-helix domain-containing protein [Gammaproteobacteria bacterium]
AAIIERHLGRAWARKSLRILVMDQARPANAAQPQPVNEIAVTNQRIKRILLLMEQNISQPLSTEELSQRLNLSKRQLERLFVMETGESLQKLYRDMRLRYGLWLLQNSGRSITDIAGECGFADTAHFSRMFRKTFGRRPSEDRAARHNTDSTGSSCT